MHRFFVLEECINNNNIEISGDDAQHISKVLRLKAGDNIVVGDGEENEYICSISSINKFNVSCRIDHKYKCKSEPPIKVHLFQAVPKSAKMDIIVQKCTELGIYAIIPVETERVVNRLNDDGGILNKVTRWQKIAYEAAKQSGRGHIPKIFSPIKYNEALERVGSEYDLSIIPYENEDKTGLKRVLTGKNNIKKISMMIGPEGGFTDEEIKLATEKKVIPVTLGPRILRTETAGFTCLSILMYELGDMGC